MSQFALPLTLSPVFSKDNFYVSGCNRDAHQWIMRWPDWPAQALLLYGPSGAGKTHLGHIWAARADAARFETLPSPDALCGHALIENIDRLPDERKLLHLLNYAKEQRHALLLTASLPPAQLPFTLPDLTSRLKALPSAAIAAPDDEALTAVLRKQFADRQLKVGDDVIAFLLPRIERSFTALSGIVEKLDSQALAEQRNLTIPFIKRALGY